MTNRTLASLRFMYKLLISLSLAINIYGQGISNFQKDEPKFRISVEKEVFVVGEPILIKMTVRRAGTIKKPSFTDDLQVKIVSDGLGEYEGALYPTMEPSIRLPVTPRLNTGEMSAYERTAIMPNIEALFNTPNVYEIRFHLTGEVRLNSNKIRIKIVEPSGDDRKAFDSLRKYLDPISYDWICSGKDCISQLEQFVDKFSGTVYGLHAKYQLANIYTIQGKFEKARQLFDTLKVSSVTYYADVATQRLREIDTSVKNPRKSEPPPNP